MQMLSYNLFSGPERYSARGPEFKLWQDIGSSQSAEDDCSIRSGRCIDPKSSIAPPQVRSIGLVPQFSPSYVKNYRRNPEYKSCAMRAPVPLYAPRPVRLVCSQSGPCKPPMGLFEWEER